MDNAAGDYRCDEYLPAELTRAGIEPVHQFEQQRGEVPAHWTGKLCGWKFFRAWYYWIAEGPSLPLEQAAPLHILFGDEVRVDGNCACPAPTGPVGGYHIDTQDGLCAFAAVLRKQQRMQDKEQKNTAL